MIKRFLPLLLTACSIAAFSQSTRIKYLSGTDKDHTVPWDFYCTGGNNSGRWTKIAVPSNWELQGFGHYNYGHDKLKYDEEGHYQYKFKSEPDWRGKKVFIVFEGSMTDTRVSLNGQPAGPVHQGSFYRFKYEITRLLKRNPTKESNANSSENLLEVVVSKMSANVSVNNAERGNSDFWLFGGIYRPVYLEIVPETFIDRIAIDAQADGRFHLDVYPRHIKSGEVLEAQVKKINGENVGKPFSVMAGSSPEKISLEKKFSAPLLWSSEFPNLYQVVVSLKNRIGIVHQVRQRFGFRTAELRKGDGFYVNGERILFKGTDRHCFWPETGRTMSHAVNLEDLRLIKEMNMNAVRMSHYPPDADFLDLCDSLGLYVLDELTGWQAAYDTLVGRKLVKEMVVRDVNHPSVVIWDNGNEGGWNRGLDNEFALYDPQQRIVIHPTERFNGTNTRHYPDYPYLVNSVANEQDVFFPTECLHGLYDGGAGAGLDDYWELMRRHPRGAGGFIWAFLDEAVIRTDKDGVYDTDGNHAPDGIVGPHREKEASFFAIKEIWSPVFVETPVLDAGFTGRLKIENRYAFTDLKQCKITWRWVNFPSPTAHKTQPIVRISGTAAPIHLSPGKTGTLVLPLPAHWTRSDALYLTAYGPDKKELFTWGWAVKTPEALRKSWTAALIRKNRGLPKSEPGVVSDRDTLLTVACDGVKYLFSKTTGYLEKLIKSCTEISLSGGPALAGMEAGLRSFHYEKAADGYKVQADYQGRATLHVQWNFSAGNPVRLDYSYMQRGVADFMGISFQYPEEKITGMKWLGKGPYRVWKNRLKGQLFGVWHKDYNDAVTGEDWNYPEFKGYHANLCWVLIENKESPFTVYTDNPNVYLQILHPKRAKDSPDKVHVDPNFPAGSIGFLNAIPPIGDKFHAADRLGPQSQPNNPEGEPVNESGTLWFDFGH